MNISKGEQRVLHVLAQGGFVRHTRTNGRIVEVVCYTRDGHVLSDCTLDIFRKLHRRKLVESRGSGPFRISELGRRAVRAQLDNR